MRFQSLTFLLFIATAIASPAGAKTDPTFCERGKKLCEIAQSWPDCSELYVQSMKAYVSSAMAGKI